MRESSNTHVCMNVQLDRIPKKKASRPSKKAAGGDGAAAMIKKPLSSYMLFVQSKRAEVKTQVP